MLFNSYAFILLFLPLTYALWTAARRFAGISWAIGILLAASLVFYGASAQSSCCCCWRRSRSITSSPG